MIRGSIAFTWPTNIEPIFRANAELIERAQREKQDALKEKREKLMNEIEKERLKIIDLEECGDIDMINQYVIDCGAIQKRINTAYLTAEAINREEELFKWEQTSYPALDIITADLLPYQTLYVNISRWQKQQKRWTGWCIDDIFFEGHTYFIYLALMLKLQRSCL
jgi:dynein heavy chain